MKRFENIDLPGPSEINGPVTVVFISSNYFDVFENWHKFAKNYTNDRLLIVALDKEAERLVVEKNLKSYYLEWGGSLSELWSLRVRFLARLLELGYDLIHSDADAIWMKDPIEYCNSFDIDMIFSQGTVWPDDVHNKLGVVVCCGFFYIRSNSKTIEFFAEWERRVLEDGDDQRALNCLLMSEGMEWPHDEDYNLIFRGKRFRCFNELQKIDIRNGLILALLPHSLFQRFPEIKEAYVMHPISEKESSSTQIELRKHGCWKLL